MPHRAGNPGIGPRLSLTLATLLAPACLAQIDAPATTTNAPTTDEQADAASWLEPLIQNLDSDDFKVRERAASDIQTDVRLNLALLQARVADPARKLTPEQKLRLNEVAVRLFRQTIRGAMGVSFARSLPEGVEIGMTIPNFDAIRVLRAGDVIQKMDGIPIITNDEARAVIISHDPGEEVRLSILRNGEPLEVNVRLGRFHDLNNAYALNDRTLREAWRIRCERITPQDQGAVPIDAGLTPAQWAQIEDNQTRRATQAESIRPVNRVPVPDEEVADALVGGGALRQLDREPMLDFVANEKDARNSIHARNLQLQIDQLTTILRNSERDLARQPNMPAERQQVMRRQMSIYRQQIQTLRNERQKILRAAEELER